MPSRLVLRPFVSIALLLALAAVALSCAARKSGDPFQMVGIDQVQRMISEPGVAVIDANTRETFEKHHLPGATHWKAKPFAEVLPPDKGTKLVFYCASPT